MKWVLLLFILCLLVACTPKIVPEETIILEPVENETMEEPEIIDMILRTGDGETISSTYYKGEKSIGIILVHMLGRERHDWDGFAVKLKEVGYHVLSIDLRGHGGSSGTYNDFEEADWRAAVNDISAADLYLEEKGIEKRAVIGASIGSNLALNFAAMAGTGAVVLLSPGLVYKGVSTESAADTYEGPLLIVASKDDTYSYTSTRALIAVSGADNIIYEEAGHGTHMFEKEPLEESLLEWLQVLD